MPRWREKPDYRHLRDLADDAAFANAMRRPTYGERCEHKTMASLCERLQAMWGDRDEVPLDEVMSLHEDIRARDPGFFGHGRNWQGAFLHDVVGNMVGWGLRLGVIAEAEPYGRRVLRLARRDPLYRRMGNGRYVPITEENVPTARGAAQAEAARLRHAEAIAESVRHRVGELADLGAPVPDWWITRFAEQFGRFEGFKMRVADARPTFEDAHRGMHLADQKRWLKALADHARTVRSELAYDRCAGRPPRYAAPDPAALPTEDAEALGELA
jgi:hypothetical protein